MLPGVMSHALVLSPGEHLFMEAEAEAEPRLSSAASDRLQSAFNDGTSKGLELLAGEFLHQPLPPTFVFWRGLARMLYTALCHNSGSDATAQASLSKPGEEAWRPLVESAPPMKGLEYLNTAVLGRFWEERR